MKFKIAIPLLVLVCGLAACASFQSTGGKLLATSALTVDAGMKGWAKYVVDHPATPQQEIDVRAAYGKYQLAMQVAQGAYTAAVATGDQSAWQRASAALQTNSDAILALIQSFSSTTNQVRAP